MASRMPPPEIPLQDDQYIEVDELKRRISENSVVIIDVRDDSEIQGSGKIATQRWINIPWDEIANEFAKTDAEFEKKHGLKKPTVPGAEVVMQCRTGRKASHAFTTLFKMGFDQMKNLKGGYNKWMESA